MKESNYVAIMALLAAMARCVNQNIGKVQLEPLDEKWTGGAKPAAPSTDAR